MPHRYDTDYEIGQDKVRSWGMDFHNPLFSLSALLVLVSVIGTIMFPGPAKEALDGSKGWSIDNFDWLFLVAGNVFVLFCIALIFLPVGRIRLGGVDARPEFSTPSWFAMLFAAGMGIGLMFWSVAEPAAYYTDWWGTPLNAEVGLATSLGFGAQQAAAITIGLPFTLVLLAMCIALCMKLKHELRFVLGDEGTRAEKTREA